MTVVVLELKKAVSAVHSKLSRQLLLVRVQRRIVRFRSLKVVALILSKLLFGPSNNNKGRVRGQQPEIPYICLSVCPLLSLSLCARASALNVN